LSVNFERGEAHGNTESISEQSLKETQVINNNPTYENIRVLIKTDNYEDVYHSNIVLEGENGMRIVADNSYIECGVGEEYAVNTSLSVDKTITVEGIDEGKLHIKSLKRNSEAKYSGKLELIFTSKGIVVINDVLMLMTAPLIRYI
jgi:stage II sporulation protein D